MQYVRSISGSVSKTWNSINPATLSGAIDVIVIEQEDGSLKCSPFHVRFGKFSLLRPYEKKVEFRVNDVKQDYAMKLGEGGEAFFVFETSDDIPESLQTSPLVSPVISPQSFPVQDTPTAELQEPDYFDLTTEPRKSRTGSSGGRELRRPIFSAERRAQSELGSLTPSSVSPDRAITSPASASGEWTNTELLRPAPLERSTSEEALPRFAEAGLYAFNMSQSQHAQTSQPRKPSVESMTLGASERSNSPPPVPIGEAVNRAMKLSRKLSDSNIRTKVTEAGDLMLDMTGFKSTEDDALRAELIARKILAEELEGNYDIGSLISADDQGNLWIYSSQEAKETAQRNATLHSLRPNVIRHNDTASDPGYHSDDGRSTASAEDSVSPTGLATAAVSDGLITPPKSPPDAATVAELSRNYAKTLRLTSDQLKALRLKPGVNSMSFNVNRATCQAYMYYWTHDVPIVISDIDGTITKSDALGHVLNMIGRDWTHIGVAKLYTDIVSNGYNIMYLTSRSVGQADTTRAYLNGVSQEGFKLPKGPVIMSPDRTIAALRREIYLRKPEVFKMACLRDIQSLFSPNKNLFYAGFGNRLTDALSYRSVNIPSRRIFTINSNAEVSLDHLSLNKYKSSYVSMRELVDHFFPAVGLLVTGGGEEFTDFNYWRSPPLELDDFSASESEDGGRRPDDEQSLRSEDEGSAGVDGSDRGDDLADSYLSRESYDETEDLIDSILESVEGADITESRIREERTFEFETAVVTDDRPSEAADPEHDTISAHTKKGSTGESILDEFLV